MHAEKLRDQRQEAIAEGGKAKVVLPAALAVGAEACCRVSVTEQVYEALRQGARPREVDVVPRLVLEVDLGSGVVDARDHRDTVAHRLDVHEPEALTAAGHREDA